MDISIPTDDDGFLKRECPDCLKIFKWIERADQNGKAVLYGERHCPLCSHRGSAEVWFTQDQKDFIKSVVASNAISMALKGFGSSIRNQPGVEFHSNDSLHMDRPTVPHETNDMQIIEVTCHPEYPFKIPEDHTENVFCIICSAEFKI